MTVIGPAAAPSTVHRRVLVPTALPPGLNLGGGAPARPVWTLSGATMGTSWQARIVARPGDGATRPETLHPLIDDALGLVVRLMSPWEPASDLARFATAAPGTWVPLAPETAKVLQCALNVATLTAGAYDPTLGAVIDLLGFGPTDPTRRLPPSAPEVRAARAAAGFAKVRFDPSRPAVQQPGGVRLDLCSIAKGYAVDLVSDRLHAAGWTNHFIEIGGEARGRGCKPDGQPWWCGLELPASSPPTVAALCDLAAATSGERHRRHANGDGFVGHIVRPETGNDPAAPASAIESVTVLASNCMEADAWATALYLLGADAGLALAIERGLAALWTGVGPTPSPDRREVSSPAFDALLA